MFVTDTGNTNAWDFTGFEVGVGNCVGPELGRQVLLAGDSGRVPVHPVSSVALTNPAMTLAAPADRVTVLRLEPMVPETCDNTIERVAAGLGGRGGRSPSGVASGSYGKVAQYLRRRRTPGTVLA